MMQMNDVPHTSGITPKAIPRQSVTASFWGVNPHDTITCTRFKIGVAIRCHNCIIRCEEATLNPVLVHMKTESGTCYRAASRAQEDGHPNALQKQNQ